MENVLIDIRNESRQIRRIFEGKDLVSVEDLLNVIEEQDDEIDELDSKMREMEEYYEENYTPKPYDPYEERGVSRSDFC